MGEILKILGPGEIGFEEYEEPELLTKQVRVNTLYSGISAGTEMSHYRGTNPFRKRKYDSVKKLFTDQEDPDYYPRGTGYEEVGKVCEIGSEVENIKIDDIIYGHWSHKSTHVLEEAVAHNQLLPKELEPVLGIFSQIGAIAFNSILDAKINLGETVAIFGQGTPGLIALQLAKFSGARVISVDVIDERLTLAKSLGADYTINPLVTPSAEYIKELTDNQGADTSIEFSGSISGLSDAIRSTVYNGRVVASGFYQENRGLALGEEFHHNRISVVCSQIGNLAPEYLNRWEIDRIYKTIMQLQADNLLKLKPLITHIEYFKDAKKIYDIINEKPETILQGVLDFGKGD